MGGLPSQLNLRQVKVQYELLVGRRRFGGAPKIFCIGRNKTGTTSLQIALKELGYSVGRQRMAEKLYDRHYFAGNFDPIIRYCKSYQAFQDVPFSCPDTFRHVDMAFPKSKFILTVRDNSEQWYNSIVRAHSKLWGFGNIPTYEQLCNARYVRKGYAANLINLYGTSKNDPYNRDLFIRSYEEYNLAVSDYFAGRPDDLLVINVADSKSYPAFLNFLGAKSQRVNFPWANKT